MNKNNFTILIDDLDKIKNYIEQTNNTTSNLRDFNDINVILDKYEQDLKIHSNEVKKLWNKFIKFLQDKFFSTNEYDDIINQLYEEKILDNGIWIQLKINM